MTELHDNIVSNQYLSAEELQKQLVIWLHRLKGIGWHAINSMLSKRLWTEKNWTSEQLLTSGLRKDQINVILTASRKQPWYEPLSLSADLLTENDVSILTVFDPLYPKSLLQIAQPPWILYIRGRAELLHRAAIAIVGTRVPTSYGRQVARSFSQKLANEGLTVVSGLARGIDAEVHKAALKETGSTIAVLPTPINRCYPPEHFDLYEAIAQEGLMISETPVGEPLHPGQFHQRNRIIAGLASATIIVESGNSGGSLITAKHALEMNREVFAVPGPIMSTKSIGTNLLIKQGAARLMMDTEQLYVELPWLKEKVSVLLNNEKGQLKDKQHEGSNGKTKIRQEVSLTNQEQLIIQLLAKQPLSIDEIMSELSIPFGHLNVLLLNLCIKQRIIQQPDSIYMLV